jgi:dGTPase
VLAFGAVEDRYRIRTEEIERETLSPRAQLAAASKGREVPEEEAAMRTAYQRDRDRIIHTKSFRRLAHKTQVFIAPEGDHYRVRLTHTLEVNQVARGIARALRLNEDLVEAICLGHDLGHTPFGHLGEEAVAAFLPGFRHNLQSVRVVDVLEPLNVTWEVRDGIANHTWSMPLPTTLEGQVARYADRIAYLNHDIDDGIRAGILSENELPEETRVLGRDHSARIERMVTDLVHASEDSPEISMSPDLFAAMGTTRDFLFARLYTGRLSKATVDGVREMLAALLDHYSKHPIPEGDGADEADEPGGGRRVRAVDYVAGMTDRFAIRAYKTLAGRPPPDFGALG